MKLHRARRKPDWARISQRHRNFWQRLAASTKGIVTWANLVTILGFVLVVVGLITLAQHHYLLGTWILFVSRLCDVLDGWLAELTGTKSPLGEALDAGFDKLSVLLALIVLPIIAIVPLWAVGALVLPHLVIAGISAVALHRGKRLHPSRLGKISTALGWLALGGFVFMKAANLGPKSVLAWVTYFLVATSLIAGLKTAVGYLKRKP